MKKNILKKVIFAFILYSIFMPVTLRAQDTRAAPRGWWYTFENGKIQFRQGNYGRAFRSFDEARQQKRAFFERLERNFIDLLSISEVRRIGDALDWVERYIQERHYAGASDALEELYYRIPRESLNNSAKTALSALGSLKDFPEAERWIGEVYLVEGELDLALVQFQKAVSINELNEYTNIPGFSTELKYKMAEIRRVRQEYNEMERLLFSILEQDRLWSVSNESENRIDSFVKQAMNRTLVNNGIDRFLLQYRYKNDETLKAHRLLGYFYYTTGRHARAQEHLMFAFIIQNTIIIEELRNLRFDFVFTNLSSLINEINRYPTVIKYILENDYFKTAYYLGASLHANANTRTAMELWNFLSVQNAAGEWQYRSIAQIASPHIEPVVERP